MSPTNAELAVWMEKQTDVATTAAEDYAAQQDTVQEVQAQIIAEINALIAKRLRRLDEVEDELAALKTKVEGMIERPTVETVHETSEPTPFRKKAAFSRCLVNGIRITSEANGSSYMNMEQVRSSVDHLAANLRRALGMGE